MTHRIMKVTALENFVVSVVFQNGVEKEYDIKDIFGIFPQFKQLEINQHLYESVKVDVGGYGISWNDELDLSAEDLWEEGITTIKSYEVDIKTQVGYKITEARNVAKMTQKDLSEKTHIYQADISKIERGVANPSLQTLERIAEGMGMTLQINFIKSEKGVR